MSVLKSLNPDDQGTCDTYSWCYHPYATYFINFGIFLYNNYGTDLTEDLLTQALDEYIELYGEPPPPPPGAIKEQK
jgi:hypothetical protein